jgi:imidazole glycerol-phosphate synthase subunit HisF
MGRVRVIPVLLLKNSGLYKSVKFKDPKYVGDPINAIKIFNEKEVDELVLLDINATLENKEPQYELIKSIASECFMPLCYGGGISRIDQIEKLLSLGVEKVCINSNAIKNPAFISEASKIFGSSTIVVSIDVKKNIWGKYHIYSQSGKINTGLDPVKFAVEMEENGVGELMINSIDKDGTMLGYDTEIIKKVSTSVSVPVIAMGGAGEFSHLAKAITEGHASAVAAGSFFVFHGKHRAVLITYPSYEKMDTLNQLIKNQD